MTKKILYSYAQKIAVLLLFILGSFEIQAQDESSSSTESTSNSGGFNIGAKALGSAGKYQDSKIGFGYGIGGFANYQFFGFLTVQVEALYAVNSGKFDDFTTDISFFDSTAYSNRTLQFQTIEIPLLARYDLSSKIFVYAGGSYSYNIAVSKIIDKTHYYNGESREFKNIRENVSSDYESYNAEALVGVGINLELFGFPSHLDLRYKQGFINQSRLVPIDGSTPDEFKSRSLSINLGVAIF